MSDEDKTKEQLVDELLELRQRVAELEASEAGRKRAEEALRQHTAQLEALRKVGLELTAQLDLNVLLHSIVSRAIELLGGTGGGLYLYRPDRDVLEWVVSIGPTVAPVGTILRRGEGLSGKVLETGEAIIVDDYWRWEGRSDAWEGYLFAAIVGAPVRWGEEFLGVLDVNAAAPSAFSPTDVELLSLFATQAAIAIKNARLYEAEQERRRIAETLCQTSTILSSTLELDEVLGLILRQLQQVMPYDSASVQRLRGEHLEIVACQGFEEPDKVVGLPFQLAPKFPNYRVVTTKAPLAIEDVAQDYPHFKDEADSYESGHIRSWLGVPLMVKDRVIGMIAMDRVEVRPYTAEEAELAMAFANQAAIAIENARLYEEVQARSRYLETLQRINATLRSTSPLSQVLEMIAQGAGEALNYIGSLIIIPDAAGERLTLGAVWGSRFLDAAVKLTGLEVASFSLPLTARENPMARAYLSGELQAWSWGPERIVAGVEPAISPKLAPVIARAMGAIGAACVPLPSGERVMGVLVVLSPREQLLDEERAMLLGLADQAGLAIENARLYEAVQQELIERRQAEEALRESEQKFRTFTESAPVAIMIYQDYQCVYANPEAEQITGYTEEELSSTNFWDFVHPDHVDVVIEGGKALERGESPPVSKYVFKIITKDGDEKWLDGRLEIIEYEGRRAALISIMDITERERAEEALRESEALIRGIVEYTPIGILYVEADGTIVYENPAMRRMMGVPEDSPSPVVGRRIQDLPTTQEADDILLSIERILRGETVAGERSHYRSLMGVELDLEVYSAPRLDSRGDVAGAVVMCANVTEQVRAEAALRESEERYRTLIAQAPIGIATCDRQGNITSLNPAILQRINSSSEEAIRQFNLLTVPSLVEAGVSDDFRRCMEEDTLVVSERLLRFQRSGEMMMRLRLAPLKDEKGEVHGVLATVEDIGEQRRLEAQLRQAQKLEAVGTLAGGIAHEFNNLLTGIIGNLSLAMTGVEPGSPAYRDLQNVEHSARRATALTRQLLALSRKPRAEQLRRLDLNPVVEEVATLLRQAIDRRIEIDTYPAADLWLVEADPNQVHQMLMNLCLNARDAIMEYLRGKCPELEKRPDGPPAIVVETENVTLGEEYCRAHLEAQPGQFVCLSASDNGCGMDAETQARVFEPFFTTKEVGQGTGLGLAMVHGIVKGHNGFINLYSEPGVGTTLKVYLPRAGEQAVTEAEAETEPAVPPAGSETILLAEDDEAVRNTGHRILESLGYVVLLAGDGREALQIYEQERGRIDLVLLDLTMPRMSGLETLRGILQIDPGARVILASGYSANGPGSVALAGGAAAFVQKPYDLHELAQAVRAVLDG